MFYRHKERGRQMKKTKNLITDFINSVEPEFQAPLEEFFINLQERTELTEKDTIQLINDFYHAFLYYRQNGVDLSVALERLDLANMGGFYAREAKQWFPLDHSAKIYPLALGYNQMAMFRVSAYLKEPVVPEILQIALTFSIKRFPQFATTLKKGFFWHYLDSRKGHYAIEEETAKPFEPIRVSLTNSRTFKVLYYQNRISVEIFHALTDGTGGIVFLKTLIREYLRLLGVHSNPDETTLDINVPTLSEENVNEFENIEKTETSGLMNKKALQMSGKLTRVKPSQIIHFKMDTQKLLATARRRNTTITGYIGSLNLMAMKYATESLSGELSIQVPVNMRKFYPSLTLRNFSMYFSLRLPIEDIKSKTETIKIVNRQLKENSTKEKMTEMAYSTKNLVHKIRFIPLAVKRPIAKQIYGFLGERAYTSTLSNLGVISFAPELTEHIESLDFVLGPNNINRTSVTLITFENVTTLSITKSTNDPALEESLLALLEADQIPVEIEGSELYESKKHLSTRK